jgi:molecular chaperone DnaJ
VTRQTVTVDVPAGIADSQRVRISGRGHVGEPGGPLGDLYVLIRVRDDDRFVRDGDDLVTALDVPAPLAALGASFEVPTLAEPATVEIAPGTQPGEVIVLRRALLEQFAATITPENLHEDESVFSKLRRALRPHSHQ